MLMHSRGGGGGVKHRTFGGRYIHVFFYIRNRTHALVLEFLIFLLISSTKTFLKGFLFLDVFNFRLLGCNDY